MYRDNKILKYWHYSDYLKVLKMEYCICIHFNEEGVEKGLSISFGWGTRKLSANWRSALGVSIKCVLVSLYLHYTMLFAVYSMGDNHVFYKSKNAYLHHFFKHE